MERGMEMTAKPKREVHLTQVCPSHMAHLLKSEFGVDMWFCPAQDPNGRKKKGRCDYTWQGKQATAPAGYEPAAPAPINPTVFSQRVLCPRCNGEIEQQVSFLRVT